MSVDGYTKAVLTVIAGTLLYISLLLSGRSVSAQGMAPAGPSVLQQTKPQAVVIVGWGTLRNDGQVFLSTIKDPNGVIHSDPTVQMKIQQDANQPITVTLGATPQHPLPVGITGIKPGTDWEPIRIKTEPQVPAAVPKK